VFNFLLELALALLVVYLIILLSVLLPSSISMMEKSLSGPPSPLTHPFDSEWQKLKKASFVERLRGSPLRRNSK
jgi:hypothetical protein